MDLNLDVEGSGASELSQKRRSMFPPHLPTHDPGLSPLSIGSVCSQLCWYLQCYTGRTVGPARSGQHAKAEAEGEGEGDNGENEWRDERE